MRFIAVVCLVFALPLYSFSQQRLTWQDVTGPPGFNALRIGDDQTLFATNGRGLVYESVDGGESWPAILAYPSSTPIDELVVNGSHVVVHLTDGSVRNSYQILVWNNSPHSWTRIFAAAPPPRGFQDFRSLMLDDSGVLYLVSVFDGRLHRYSSQTGWSTIGSQQAFLSPTAFTLPALVSVIDHEDRIFIGSSFGGFFISEDTGKSWRSTLARYAISAIDATHLDRLIVGGSPSQDLRTNGGVFASSDSGRTWVGLGLEEKSITSLSSDDNGNVLALADGDVYKYDSATKTWDVTNHLQDAFTTLVKTGTQFFASSEATSLTRSLDGGNTWAGGLLRGRDIFALTVTTDGTLLAGTLGGGVYRSQLGSALWTALPSGTMSDYVYDFTQTSDAILAGTDNGVYRSTDNGRSWSRTNDSTLAGPAYALDAASDGTLFAGTLFGVLRSTDGGHAWQKSGNLSSKVLFMDVSQADEILAATDDTGVFLSSDHGQTWTSLGVARSDIQTVKFGPSGSFLIGVYGGVYLSTDRGASWNYRSVNTTAYTYVLALGANQTVYAGTYQGVFASTDGGTGWAAAGDSGMTSSVVLSLDVAPDGSLLAGSYRGGVYKSKQSVLSPAIDNVSPNGEIPLSIALAQNYPNPFNPTTRFEFQIADREPVKLSAFDLLGREVATIVNENLPPGKYSVTWNAGGVASGIYLYKLQTRTSTIVRKMILMK